MSLRDDYMGSGTRPRKIRKQTTVKVKLPIIDGYDAIRFLILLNCIKDAVWDTWDAEMTKIFEDADPIVMEWFESTEFRTEKESDFPPLDEDNLPF